MFFYLFLGQNGPTFGAVQPVFSSMLWQPPLEQMGCNFFGLSELISSQSNEGDKTKKKEEIQVKKTPTQTDNM